MGVVQYHLYSFEGEKEATSHGDRGLYKRFYPNLVFGEHQKDILYASLEGNGARLSFCTLMIYTNATQKQVSEYSRISAGTINWHMKRLGLFCLISIKREGQFVRYTLNVEFRGDFEVTPELPSKRLENSVW